MGPTARVALFKTLGAVLEVLPERVDVAIASCLAETILQRNASTRANLSHNLARVLAPEGGEVGAEQLDEFVRRGFRSYGQYWAEGAKLPALDPRTITERFAIAEGLEHLHRAKARGRGVVVALPHVGSWEWGGSFLHSIDLSMTAVAEELDPPELFAWFKKKRESIGIRILPLNDQAGTLLLQALARNDVVGLLCDRDLQGNGVEVTFFGERVTMPAGPATLALRSGATLVAAACYAGPARDHFAVISPPISTEREGRLRGDVTRVTQAVATNLEALIRRAPEQWHVLEERFATS